jgi:hypothetical protein
VQPPAASYTLLPEAARRRALCGSSQTGRQTSQTGRRLSFRAPHSRSNAQPVQLLKQKASWWYALLTAARTGRVRNNRQACCARVLLRGSRVLSLLSLPQRRSKFSTHRLAPSRRVLIQRTRPASAAVTQPARIDAERQVFDRLLTFIETDAKVTLGETPAGNGLVLTQDVSEGEVRQSQDAQPVLRARPLLRQRCSHHHSSSVHFRIAMAG